MKTIFSLPVSFGSTVRRLSMAAPSLPALILAWVFSANSAFAQSTAVPPPNFAWTPTGYSNTGAGYTVGPGQISRAITDIRVTGGVGEKPLTWTRTLRQVNTGNYPAATTWGPVWSFSYNYAVTRDFLGDSAFDSPVVKYPSGVAVKFDQQSGGAWRAALCPDRLVEIALPSGATKWELQSPDGTKVNFESLDGNQQFFYPLSIIDRYGLQTTLIQNASAQQPAPSQVTDASGRWIKVDYAMYNNNKVPTHVYSSDGQEVWYVWNGGNSWREVKLLSATYSDGTAASYTYVSTANGYIPEICRDVRCETPVRNVKYEFTLVYTSPNPRTGANLHFEREADSGAIISERILPAQYVQEKRGDGAIRTLGCTGDDYLLQFETDYLGHTQSYTYHTWGGFASVTDARGYVTQYQREALFGLETKVTYPDGNFETSAYTGTHPLFLNSHTDARGYSTTYTRLANGLVSQISYPDNSTEGWTYNGFNQPATHRLKNGNTESYTYTPSGLLSQHALPTSPDVIDYTYYPAGDAWVDKVKTVTDGRGNVTTYEYDLGFVSGVQGTTHVPGRGKMTKITNPDGTYKTFGYNIYGDKIWQENELRQRTTYTYDAYGRVLSVTDPLARTTQYIYQHSGFSEDPLVHTANLPRAVILPTGKRKGFLYDANFRLTSEVSAESTIDASSKTFEYDAAGNLTKMIDPVSRVTTYVYDNRNRRTTENAPLSRTTLFGYDASGNQTSVTYPDNSGISKLYDTMNRLSRLTDEMSRATNYAYYASGKILRITDPKNNTYEYTYDAADRTTAFKLTNPTQSGFDTEQTSYDGAGNVITFRNRSGALKTLVYDNRNRETSYSWNDGVTLGIGTGYDSVGRVTQKTNSTSTLNFTYDAAGQVTQEQQAVAGTTSRAVQYTYDVDGNRTVLKVQ